MWNGIKRWYRSSEWPLLIQVFLEFLVGIVFATSPFWLGAGIFALTHEFRGLDWSTGQALLSTFGRGELLIFAVTFVAPMFWTVSLDPEGSKGFPGRPIWVTSIGVTVLFAAAFYAVWRAHGYSANSYESVISWSIFAALAAMTLRYIILALHHRRMPHPEKALIEETNDFANDYAETRAEGGQAQGG